MSFRDEKHQFPIFTTHPELVYFDSAATSLKPKTVIDKERAYYEQYTANVHRGIYAIAEQATAEYEKTRQMVATFIGAARPEEIVFTRGTTEVMNLLASSLGSRIQAGDEIVTSHLEHHSNFVPWQQLAKRTGAIFTVIPVRDDGFFDVFNAEGTEVNPDLLSRYIHPQTRIVALNALSNVLGTRQPIAALIRAIKQINPDCIVILDAAQAVPHGGVNVQELGADFIGFSSHKMFGPTGVGILWGRYDQLNALEPYQYGGEMVYEVGVEDTTFKPAPLKFEAGTPNIAGVIGLQAAIEYIQSIGFEAIRDHENDLVSYAMESLKSEFADTITILGTQRPEQRAGILSFTFGNYHAHDIAQILDEDGIAVRAGHHCTMPLHKRFDVAASIRVSFSVYNSREDIDRLITSLQRVGEVLG